MHSQAGAWERENLFLLVPKLLLLLVPKLLLGNACPEAPLRVQEILLVIGYLTQLNWLAVLLVLISSIIVLMQTYLNLIPTIENHKQIAERFLILSQDYSRISATYQDKNFELADLLAALEKISEEHHKLLKEGQVFPTNYSDYREDSKKWYHFNVCGL